MIDDLATIYQGLEEDRSAFLARLRQFSPPQASFRPDADAWSPLQVAHHVVLAEGLIVDALIRAAGTEATPRSTRENLMHAAVRCVLALGIKVKNPAPPTTPADMPELESVEADWDTARERLSEYLGSLDAADLDGAGFRHPIAGPLDLRESLRFLSTHVRHHRRQLGRLARHPDLPS